MGNSTQSHFLVGVDIGQGHSTGFKKFGSWAKLQTLGGWWILVAGAMKYGAKRKMRKKKNKAHSSLPNPLISCKHNAHANMMIVIGASGHPVHRHFDMAAGSHSPWIKILTQYLRNLKHVFFTCFITSLLFWFEK